MEYYQNTSHLERPRLNKLLEEAMEYPLVTIYAGTGYGKTRMVYSFLRKYPANTTWVQISERDNMATRFWENFKHVASISVPKIGERLSEIGFPATQEAFDKFEKLANEVGALPEKHVIVCDDFHLLNNPVVMEFFVKLINILPQNMTMILISRTTPEVNLIEMLVQEQVFTIHENALRFSEEEIARYFNQLQLPATRPSIKNIYDDTQGWAFAVNLIARSLRKDMTYERCALNAMKDNIFKLIDAELYRTVSEPLFQALLRISLIDHLTASIIRKLVKDETLLKEMEQLNAYIRYDSFLGAYVIHHLFLDYLRHKTYLISDSEKRRVYKMAGDWCEANGQYADAITYYEKSEDYDAITKIVASFSVQIPQDMARYALDIFNGAPEEVASLNPIFQAMKLKLKVNLGEFAEAATLAERYAKEYEAQPETPERNRSLAAVYATWALLRMNTCTYTDVYDFDLYFQKMREYYDKNPFKILGAYESLSVSAWASLVGTHRAEAHEEYIDAISRTIPHVSHVLNGMLTGFDDLVRGEVCYFCGEHDEAEEYLQQAISKAQVRDQYDAQSRALVYLMQIAFHGGYFMSAGVQLREIEKLLEIKDYKLRYKTYDIARGFYHLALDEPELVPDWLKGDFTSYAHPSFLDNYANLVKAQYHYQTRRHNALLAFIENVIGERSVLYSKIGLHAMLALLQYSFKQYEDAYTSLTEAYRLAEPSGIITPFTQYGKDMRTLSAAALKSGSCGIPDPWLENINRKSSAYAKRKARMIADYKAANKIEERIALTKRETEVLVDLSHGLSRTEIAASQNISANTVKMTVGALYEKLRASNLTDAVRIAVEQKII